MKIEYAGSTMTRDDSWMLELAHVPTELREEEPALQRTRWFDQRHLLPAQATEAFARTYEQVYRDKYEQWRDRERAAEIKVLHNQDLFKSPDLLPFWRARQEADRIGCKYPFYLAFIFDRCFHRGWRYMPRPNQLYAEEISLDVADAWRELRKASLQLAENPRFKSDAYTGHPDQRSYHEYLIQQVNDRVEPHLVLARLLYREKILPVEVAAEHFSPSTLERAFSHFYS